jgi:hypothetical protein
MSKEIKWETYEYNFDDVSEDDDIEEDEDDDDEDDDEYEDKEHANLKELIKLSNQKAKVINTPFGMFQVDDKMNPFRQFEFWMGHTNFDLTKSVVDTIESVPGVEVLIVLTRYRFIIAVGSMFKFPDVRVKVEKILCNKHYNLEEIQENDYGTNIDTVLDVKNTLKLNHNLWSIYVFPNGKLTFATTPEGVAATKNMKELSAGILITSDDEE